ncbi:MAG: DUF1684 domain-containing protein [Candidatus Limnocylindrales bacterium]
MTHDEHVHTFDWRAELEAMREAARHFYQHQFDWKGQGPAPGFDGPRYFPPASEWRLLCTLDRATAGAGDTVTLATSTGQLRQMVVAGQLVFLFEAIEYRLTGFLTHDAEGYEVIFLPFRDETSGKETYGAGRYVEVPYDKDDEEFELDFNLAYNPSCAFSPAYDCPYPPPGNRLTVEVRAGEMLPTHE